MSRYVLILLALGLNLGLASCRSITVVRYRSSLIEHKTFDTKEFEYSIGGWVDNNSPTLQHISLTIRSRSPKELELSSLVVSLRWIEGSETHTQVPYNSLSIANQESRDSGLSFHRHSAQGDGMPSFDLERLTPRPPQKWRLILPGTSASYTIYFSKPDLPCIPDSIDRVILELSFSVRAADKTRVVARSVELTPRVDRFTEHYNLKSRSWSITKCRTSRR